MTARVNSDAHSYLAIPSGVFIKSVSLLCQCLWTDNQITFGDHNNNDDDNNNDNNNDNNSNNTNDNDNDNDNNNNHNNDNNDNNDNSKSIRNNITTTKATTVSSLP